MMNSARLSEHFNRYFTLVVADTPKLQEEAFKLRYQVYCEELNYEPKEIFPDGMERDKYDNQSIHFLLQHKPTASYAGCVRAVLTKPNQPEAPFPFERVCSHNIDFQHNSHDRNRFFEVSRLAVLAQFRKRKGETSTSRDLLFDEKSNSDQRQYPLISLSLYFTCISVALKFGNNLFALMEPRLSRHLRIFGIPSHQIGEAVDYHGLRAPFLINPHQVLERMNAESRELFDHIYSLHDDSNYSLSNPSVAA